MKIDPVIKRDMTVSSRSTGLAVLIVTMNTVLFAVSFLGVFGRLAGMQAERMMDYRVFLMVYAVTVAVILLIVVFVLPGFTSGSLASERDHGTLDLMLASGLTPFRVCLGKLVSALLKSLVLIFSFLPAMLIPLIFGGVGFQSCVQLLCLMIPTALLTLSAGLFAGAKSRSASTAAALCYGLIILFTVGPAALSLLISPFTAYGRNYAALSMLLSPITGTASVLSAQLGETELIARAFGYLNFIPGKGIIRLLPLYSLGAELFASACFFAGAVLFISPRKKHRG